MKKLRITVGKKTYDVTVEVVSDDDAQRVKPAVPRATGGAASTAPTAPVTAPIQQVRASPGAVTSPMSGVVKSILVQVGEAVQQGQSLVVLDAMKMEVPIAAPIAGAVESISAKEGQSVQEGQILLVLS